MVSWEPARSNKGVWKGEKVENEEAARDTLEQSDKQIICLLTQVAREGEHPARSPEQASAADPLQPWGREEKPSLLSKQWVQKRRPLGIIEIADNHL